MIHTVATSQTTRTEYLLTLLQPLTSQSQNQEPIYLNSPRFYQINLRLSNSKSKLYYDVLSRSVLVLGTHPGPANNFASLLIKFRQLKGGGQARGSVMVKALCYKPEGLGFDTQ
jgi:hypothetical protein